MFRGIELILKGRDPRDAWAFTQRICGVCTTVHAIASIRAVETAVGAAPPPNARLLRNLIIGAQCVQDHVIHFYHLHALDWVDLVSALLVLTPVLSWTWIVLMARDMYGPMTGASAWMMTAQWDAPHLLLLWAMWSVMMTAMMLPSAAPLILLYGAAARRSREESARWNTYALAAGYLATWTAFSLAATALQRALAQHGDGNRRPPRRAHAARPAQ